jgi:hypothetical protein
LPKPQAGIVNGYQQQWRLRRIASLVMPPPDSRSRPYNTKYKEYYLTHLFGSKQEEDHDEDNDQTKK